MRSRRQREVRALVERARELPPEQLGGIWVVLIGHAFAGAAFEVVLLVSGVRAALRVRRARPGGLREVTSVAGVRSTLVLAGIFAGYRVVARVVLVRWVRRVVERAEADGA